MDIKHCTLFFFAETNAPLSPTPCVSHAAPRGANFIDIRERDSGWRSGDELVLAPTDYWPEEAEYITIDRVKVMPAGGDRIFLTKPLLYHHFGEGYQVSVNTANPTPHDGRMITEMSAEVGLLTHNIVVRGDDQTYDIQFGAQILLSSPGDESLIGRMEGVEVRDAGQGFFLGRYAVHFHLVGAVKGSYVRKCSIHHSFNRAVAIHGIDHLRVQNNVAFDVRGMAFFTEDGVERFSIVEDNLAVQTRALWSLLIVDQTPAAYWFTNADSHIRRNVAAGSDNFGFWIRPLPHPDGLSETTKYCPDATPLGSWQDNVAHSTRMYGLKLQDWQPRKNGYYCGGNIPEQAHFNGGVLWKIGMAGIWASCTTGDECDILDHITIDNFAIFDAKHSAWEAWQFGSEMRVQNALMVGKSTNNATLVHDVLVAVRNDQYAREEDLVDENNLECGWNMQRPRRFACGNDAAHFFHGKHGLWMRFDLNAPLLLSHIHILNYNGEGETDRGVKKANVYFLNPLTCGEEGCRFDSKNQHQFDSDFDPSGYTEEFTKQIELPRATGDADYSHYYHLDCTGITAQYVAIVPTEYYGDATMGGLSHVQFFRQTNKALGTCSNQRCQTTAIIYLAQHLIPCAHITPCNRIQCAHTQICSWKENPRVQRLFPEQWAVCSGTTSLL